MSSEEQAPQLKDLGKKSKDDNKADPKKAEEEEEIGKRKIIKIIFSLQFFLDIDLNDPEVEAAAAKIQSAFKFRMKGKKN